MDIFTYTFPNGIRLVHHKILSPVGCCGIMINTGSRDEKDEEHGMAHFIEHVIFKGTQKRKTYHILSRIDDVGGELNAYTTKEETCIYASYLIEDFDRALELLHDITFNSTFPAKELEKEKEVIVDEINSYKDNPSELIIDDFEELIFADDPMGRNILGTPEKLMAFGQKEIKRFIAENYHTDQMVICSVGQMEPLKVLKIASKYFKDIPGNLRVNACNKVTGKRTEKSHYLLFPKCQHNIKEFIVDYFYLPLRLSHISRAVRSLLPGLPTI
jgi:predicted Zn-dependent peptidase